MYGLLGLLLTRELAFVAPVRRAVLGAIVGAAIFGAVDEWHQGFIPGRDRDVADWRADSIGAASGAVLWAAYRRNRRASTTNA